MRLMGKKLGLFVSSFVVAAVFLGGICAVSAADSQVQVTTSVADNKLTSRTDSSQKKLLDGKLKAVVEVGSELSKIEGLRLGFKYWDASNPSGVVTVQPENIKLSDSTSYSFEYPTVLYIDGNTTYNCVAFAILLYEDKEVKVEGNTLILGSDGSVTVIEQTTKKPGFADVKGHWAKDFINELGDRGIVNGYPSENASEEVNFKPDTEISRAEVTVLVLRAAGIEPVQDNSLSFSDNARIPDYAKGYVAAAVKKGIIKGYSADNTFKPRNSVKREEFAAIVMRAFGFAEAERLSNLLDFVDCDNISEYSKGYVEKAVELGIINGYSSDNTFRPQRNVTRAEVAKMVIKCLEEIEK